MTRSQDDDETLATRKVVRLDTVFRDTSPREQGWLALQQRLDPLRSASITIGAAVTTGAAAWVLHGADLGVLSLLAAFACAGALGLLSLVVGRAVLRARVIDYWEESVRLRRAVDVHRRRSETLVSVLELAACDPSDSLSRLDDFAERAGDYLRSVRGDAGLVVVRATRGRYLVEGVGGRVADYAVGVHPGKSCSADRSFGAVLETLAEANLAVNAISPSREQYWLGLLFDGALPKTDRDAVAPLEYAFALLVRAADEPGRGLVAAPDEYGVHARFAVERCGGAG
jgi:hypothetical protein